MAEMPRFAHLTILLLMGSELLVALILLGGVLAVISGRWRHALLAAGVAAAVAVGYACVLLGVGWLSPEKTLAPGQWKYFCEADCHIAYAIEDVRIGDAAGAPPGAPQSHNVRLAVRLRTWFDQNSIASFRGNAPFRPEPRRVVLVDGDGRVYSPLPETESAAGEPSTPMTQPLRPGESYLTSFEFEVPRPARDLRLLITDVDSASRFIIDHENSPLHGKILLGLAASGGA